MPATATEQLVLHGVKKTFHMGEVDVPVLHGIDLAIAPGQITVILGPSGSGKTTLLNLIGGIDQPTEGSVSFEGTDLATLSERALTSFRRENVGFIFQFYNLVSTLTAAENVQVSVELTDDPIPPAEALRLVGLADRADHFPAQMSGGEQQRVAIARAIAKRPKLLLCDEPTGALDFATGRVVLELLLHINETLGTTVVIITHVGPIAELAHQVVRIGSGLIVEQHENVSRKSVDEIRW